MEKRSMSSVCHPNMLRQLPKYNIARVTPGSSSPVVGSSSTCRVRIRGGKSE